jgi:adenylosuccinate synthase
MVSDLTHRLLDLAWEDYRVNVLAEEPRGSTGRGITPAYLDEVGQQQITYSDFLAGPNYFARKLAQRADRACAPSSTSAASARPPGRLLRQADRRRTRANAEAIEARRVHQGGVRFHPVPRDRAVHAQPAAPHRRLLGRRHRLAQNIGEVRELILRELAAGRTVIGEFGQAYWLDKRHGFSPNVTASHTYTPEFFESAGIPVQRIHTFGVAKAYDTKVGTHTFLTQMDDAIR